MIKLLEMRHWLYDTEWISAVVKFCVRTVGEGMQSRVELSSVSLFPPSNSTVCWVVEECEYNTYLTN